MITVTSPNTKKIVQIMNGGGADGGYFIAFLVQPAMVEDGYDVLDSKIYHTEKACIKWAEKILNQ